MIRSCVIIFTSLISSRWFRGVFLCNVIVSIRIIGNYGVVGGVIVNFCDCSTSNIGTKSTKHGTVSVQSTEQHSRGISRQFGTRGSCLNAE